MYFGMVVWFIFRWILIILSYLLVFIVGGMDGPLLDRFKQIQLPKIQIKTPLFAGKRLAPKNFIIDYYTVVVGATNDRVEAAAIQSQLNRARIRSHVVIQDERYFVCVGKYPSSRDANEALRKVHDKNFESAIVVGPPNI